MYVLGYSLDNLSLMALTIAVGFVVDDAIVMIENIVRHIEDGATPMQAALDGAGEIGFTIMSISISLIAVFIPLFLMSGVVGLLFREFAVTVAVAIVVSVVVSLTPDADDVRAPADAGRPWRSGARLARARAVLRWSGRRLRSGVGRRAALPLDHIDGHDSHRLRDGRALRGDPEGILPAAGYRDDRRHQRGGRRTFPRRA